MAEARGHPTEAASLVEHGVLGWVRYEGEGLPTHLVPTWDIRGHCLGACACGAEWDEIGELYVHRAFDGRDLIESGERKIN